MADDSPRPWLFRKGEPSRNPGGRARTFYKLAERIRRRTGNGSMMVSFAMKALAGKFTGMQFQHRMDALYWLADRGWGKPTQSVEFLGSDNYQPSFSIGTLNILQAQGVASQLQPLAVEAIKSAQQPQDAPKQLLPPRK